MASGEYNQGSRQRGRGGGNRMQAPEDIFKMPTSHKLPNPLIPSYLKCNNLKDAKFIPFGKKPVLDIVIGWQKGQAFPELYQREVFETLLFMEQYEVEKELTRHNLLNQVIYQCDDVTFQIDIVMDRNDPFVVVGDDVVIKRNKVVVQTAQIDAITGSFIQFTSQKPERWYKEGATYEVSFKVNHYPMRCFHYALQSPSFGTSASLLHLMPQRNLSEKRRFEERIWFNKSIEQNEMQRQAVECIVAQAAKPAPYVVFGPPGTGKTATLVEAVCQIWRNYPDKRVLICTPSNAAADEILKRILASDVIPKENLLRIYNPSIKMSSIDKEIIPCANLDEHNTTHLPLELVERKTVIVTTLVTSMRLVLAQSWLSNFSYVIIDEAGQATEPETLIPFELTKSECQVVLAGDPKQLGPVIKSRAAEPLLGISMLERIMTCPVYSKLDNQFDSRYITKLVHNFRSHEAILRVPNELFYDNELVSCGGNVTKLAEEWKYLQRRRFPVIFHAVDGKERGEARNDSTYNEEELDVVFDYIDKLGRGSIKFQDSSIGVITPFKLQETRIKEKLRRMNRNHITVGTVQIFQGQEKDVMILSTVRSRLLEHEGRRHIGFLSNEKRFNVAITRAKALLIVVGNPNILKTDPNWRRLMTYCQENGACTGDEVDLRDLEEGEVQSLLDRKKRKD